jgi:formate/nitrite transporter FocA (FNT family)
MRKMMITGGAVGFGIGVLSGLATDGTAWPAVLIRASVGALVLGLLFRWWAGVWAGCWVQAQTERQSAEEKSEATPLSAFTK